MPRKPWAGQGSRQERGYGAAWQKLRRHILARDKGLCQPCLRMDRVTEATQVDHIKPKARGGTDDEDNLQGICSPCHKLKTVTEDKGYEAKRLDRDDGWRP